MASYINDSRDFSYFKTDRTLHMFYNFHQFWNSVSRYFEMEKLLAASEYF